MKRATVLLILLVLILSACSDTENVQADNNLSVEENVRLEIESALMKIVETPSSSSNPSDYVKASQEEYDYIVGLGNNGLNYTLNKFSISESDGLTEYVMAMACAEILGDLNPVKEWDTGRTWYNKYVSLPAG
ncbi:hypothetical protein SAMN04487944_12838 [Gracilibacillus ureilyticus]|uniref:Uncharacterized protein n=1 Tax=Gracilibacillus ureilyticus TaxID=531814 RepID=A0A1H9VW68_9BACI|nr:hypothetical protein [Gracilibacillus ureilyticus]SES25761.1 hypothetical protein SAMN04487944_12838 [Gracilibacillus ureilyticus]